MLSSFFPADRLESYRTSPYKDRIDRIGQRLVEQRYHPEVTAQHLREWLRVARYLQAQEFRLPLALDAPEVAQYVTDRVIGLSASRTRFVWAAVRIFLDADEHGNCRRRIGQVPRPAPSWSGSAVVEYTTFLSSHRGLAPPTVGKRVWQAHALRGVPRAGRRDPARRHHAPSHSRFPDPAADTGRRHAPDLRDDTAQLLPVGRDDRVAPPRPQCGGAAAPSIQAAAPAGCAHRARGDPPSAWRRSLVGDRPAGLRRLLLLATRYGLRPCDLRQLRLEAVDWREGVLSITQAKTGRVLTLPLLADVADALIAYLRNGRPATPSRYVFVRHKAPFEPFVAANNLATIMRQALQRVGLDQREGRRGLYLLRHTLASRMLASGSPLKHIGDVLGHASTDTTMEYASVDLTALRRVAISEAEVRP